MEHTLTFCLLLCCLQFLKAQDTLLVHFGTGKSTVSKYQAAQLRKIPQQFDLSKAIRIDFVGYADTTGSQKSNLRLSEQRAESVRRACQPFLKDGLPAMVIGKGEKLSPNMRDSRIVELIIHYPPIPPALAPIFATEPANEVIQVKENVPATTDSKGKCFYPANRLIHFAGKREVIQNGKPFVMLEWDKIEEFKGKKFYWARNTAADTLQFMPLRMEMRVTGRKWWKERRYTALIPKASYEKWQMFEIGKPPCNDCSIDLPNEQNTFKCRQLDRYLMENLQVRKWWMVQKDVRVRVPKEYVDLKAKYYVGCYNIRLYWEEGKKGRKQDYCFTKLPMEDSRLENIVKEMPCCETNPEPSACDAQIIKLVPPEPFEMGKSLTFVAGSLLRPGQSAVNYAGLLGNIRTDHFRFQLMAGIDPNLNPTMRLQSDLILKDLPTSALLPFSAWRKPEKIKNFSTATFYGGANLWYFRSQEQGRALWPELHLGMSMAGEIPWSSSNYWRLFLQPGIGLNPNPQYFQIAPSLHLGLNISLLKSAS